MEEAGNPQALALVVDQAALEADHRLVFSVHCDIYESILAFDSIGSSFGFGGGNNNGNTVGTTQIRYQPTNVQEQRPRSTFFLNPCDEFLTTRYGHRNDSPQPHLWNGRLPR